MSIQALRERLTTVTWRPTYRELEAALTEIAALETQLAEANRERERANMLALDLVAQLQQRLNVAEARAEAAESELANTRFVMDKRGDEVELLRGQLVAAEARESRLLRLLEKVKQQVPTCNKWDDWQEEWQTVGRLVEDALRPDAEQPDAPESEAERLRAEEAQAEVVRLTNVLTRIRDERGVMPYYVAREALKDAAERPEESEETK